MATTPKLEDVTRILKRHLPDGYGAVLFGSRATGRAHAGSDWDIGVLGPAPLRSGVVESIREELDELPTLHTFDVVDLAIVPEYFRDAVLRGAKEISPATVFEQFKEVMIMQPEDKISLTAFESALARLGEALAAPPTELGRDGAIQRFEFTFELAWKTTIRAIRAAGAECGATPRAVIRAALTAGWIEDDDLWLRMLKSRNLTSQAYDRVVAEEIFDCLPEYKDALSDLLNRLKQIVE